MAKYIKCVPNLNTVQKEKIQNLLTTLQTDEQLTSSVIDIVLNSNPEFITHEKDFTVSETGKFNQLPEELQSLLNEVVSIIGKRAGVDKVALQNELRSRSKDPANLIATPIATNEAISSINEDSDNSNDEFSDDESNEQISNSQVELNEITAKEISILKGKPTFSEILKWYFPIDQRTNIFQEEFRSFFVNTFINSVYGSNAGDTNFNTPKRTEKIFKALS